MKRDDAPLGLDGRLAHLERADLIRLAAAVPELTYLFRHALIQESAYQSLLRADRRRVHRAAGETLETLFAGRQPPSELAPQLARHFEEAGDDARALRYYTLAGDQALARFANPEAVAAFTCALAAAERLPAGAERPTAESGTWEHLFSARGRALELDSQYAAALANYQSMAQRAAALGHRHLALSASLAMSQLYATATPLFDPPLAERLTEAALAEARALGEEAAEAKILWTQLNLYRLTRRFHAARESGERSLEIARRLGLTGQAALALNDLIHVYTDLGLWPEAEQAGSEAHRLWGEMGNTAMLADSLSTAAFTNTFMGKFELALAMAREAHTLTLAIDNLWGQAYSLSAMGWAYWYTGHPDQAMATTEACIRVGQQAGYLGVEGYDRARLAYMTSALGDSALAQALAQQAAQAIHIVETVGIGTLSLVQIHLDLRRGDVAQAAARLEAIAAAVEHPPHWEVSPLLQAQAEVALAQGDPSRAWTVTEAHVARLRALGLRMALPEALIGLARALLTLKRAAEARAALFEALDHTQAMNAIMLEWQVRYAMGQLERAQGSGAAAEPHWTRAREIVQVIAERIPTSALRQSFVAGPEVRALFNNN